ncbi:ribonuclease D [Nonomuraea wenchangensis]|uniref:ribonuclease D n=1 Tax=Nonomuraea wenchangensis TaxID=568860 RepID=UPI00384ED15A
MLSQTNLVEGDLPADVLPALRHAGVVACDIETSGLDWKRARIATVQLYTPDVGVIVLKVRPIPPRRLISVIEDRSIIKVFHHAPFDLRFLRAHWGVDATSVICTKVASRLIDPDVERSQHSLKPLLSRYLDVDISKTQQRSNWAAPSLSAEQVEYAAEDVRHLLDLWTALESRLGHADLLPLYRKCMAFMPTQVQLEIRGIADVFAH